MARSADKTGTDGPIIIKKYANRRLYNTRDSKYITLDFLADLTRKEIEFQVLDAKTGEDITHNVLTQIIMDEENSGENMLPTAFLRQLIALYGGDMRANVPQFLENALDAFREGHKKVESALETALTSGPFGDLAKQNIDMMKAARDALIPGLAPKEKNEETFEDLQRQMAALQAKIDRLAKK